GGDGARAPGHPAAQPHPGRPGRQRLTAGGAPGDHISPRWQPGPESQLDEYAEPVPRGPRNPGRTVQRNRGRNGRAGPRAPGPGSVPAGWQAAAGARIANLQITNGPLTASETKIIHSLTWQLRERDQRLLPNGG